MLRPQSCSLGVQWLHDQPDASHSRHINDKGRAPPHRGGLERRRGARASRGGATMTGGSIASRAARIDGARPSGRAQARHGQGTGGAQAAHRHGRRPLGFGQKHATVGHDILTTRTHTHNPLASRAVRKCRVSAVTHTHSLTQLGTLSSSLAHCSTAQEQLGTLRNSSAHGRTAQLHSTTGQRTAVPVQCSNSVAH